MGNSAEQLADLEEAEMRLIHIIDAPIRLNNFDTGNISLHYASAGSGVPLLLIHGANIGWGSWYCNIPALARSFALVLPDLPGCGGSSPMGLEQDSRERTIESIIALKKRLWPEKSIAVAGHSFGAWLAMQLLHRYPEHIRKVLAFGPVGLVRTLPITQYPISISAIAWVISKTVFYPSVYNLKRFMAMPLFKKTTMPKEFIEYYRSAILKKRTKHPILFMSELSRMVRLQSEMYLGDILKNNAGKARCIIGERDPFFDANFIAQEYGSDLICIMKGVGHVPPIEDPAGFNRIVLDFLLE